MFRLMSVSVTRHPVCLVRPQLHDIRPTVAAAAQHRTAAADAHTQLASAQTQLAECKNLLAAAQSEHALEVERLDAQWTQRADDFERHAAALDAEWQRRRATHEGALRYIFVADAVGE